MKKLITMLLSFLLALGLTAQEIIDFEDFPVPLDSFLNGSDGGGGFSTGGLFFPNDYNPDFQSWTGWAISSSTDILTPGFTNQYSAIPGAGFGPSANYAVSYIFSGAENRIILDSTAAGTSLEGLYLTNSTFTYLSMRDGDAFAKKFGGESGDDPDFFYVTIKKYLDGNLSADSINVYLADFRFEDNNQDYILDEWTWVDLSVLGPADSLSFRMSSSDVGQFGINTPTYFCIDEVQLASLTTSVNRLGQEFQVEVFPNPVQETVYIRRENTSNVRIKLTDLQGRPIWQDLRQETLIPIDVSSLPAGTYVLVLTNEKGGFARQLIVKQ